MATAEQEVKQEAQALESEARRMGWKPKEEFRRPPEEWVDAKTFVERGKTILPIVQSRLERTEVENQQLRDRLAASEARAAEQQTQIDGLKTFSADVQKQNKERMRTELLAEFEEARKAGDTKKEAEVLDKLAEARAPATPSTAPGTAAKTNGESGATAVKPQTSAAFEAWKAENTWFTTDPVMRAASVAISAELRAQGKLEGLDERGRLELLTRETLRRFQAAPAGGGAARVEGGARPSGASAVSDDKPSYEKLSPDLQAACDGQAERLGIVGKGKAFETLAAWRQHYAEMVA